MPFVDVVATLDAQNGQACVLMLNRDLEGERELALEWRDVTPTRVLACETLTGPDLKAFNTFEQPRRVAPQRLDAPAAGGAHDVQAAGPVLHRGADRDDGLGWPHRCTNAAESGRSLRLAWCSLPFPR